MSYTGTKWFPIESDPSIQFVHLLVIFSILIEKIGFHDVQVEELLDLEESCLYDFE